MLKARIVSSRVSIIDIDWLGTDKKGYKVFCQLYPMEYGTERRYRPPGPVPSNAYMGTSSTGYIQAAGNGSDPTDRLMRKLQM